MGAGEIGTCALSYRIEFTTKAADSFAKLPKEIQAKLADQIDRLAEDPRPPGCRKITGHDDCYRIRQGDYRIVYAVIQQELYVLIVRAGHRKEIYDRMEGLTRMIESIRKSHK